MRTKHGYLKTETGVKGNRKIHESNCLNHVFSNSFIKLEHLVLKLF